MIFLWINVLNENIFKQTMFFSGLPSSSNAHSQQILEENRQAIILFAIVSLFFICHVPRNFLNIHEALTFEQKKQDYFHGCGGMPLWILVIGLVSHLLLSCNSAFNFFLYCAMSNVFRHELFALSIYWRNTVGKLFSKNQRSGTPPMLVSEAATTSNNMLLTNMTCESHEMSVMKPTACW
jgi:hypothetical protein